VRVCMRAPVFYLAKEADVEAEGLGVPGAGVHVVAHHQHQLQQLAEALALLHLLTGEGDAHDVGPDVVHLLLEGQLEQDAVEPRTQHFHRAHLAGNHRDTKRG